LNYRADLTRGDPAGNRGPSRTASRPALWASGYGSSTGWAARLLVRHALLPLHATVFGCTARNIARAAERPRVLPAFVRS
jgi:hypothetical protein